MEKVAGTHPKVYVGGAYVWGKGEVNTKRDIRTDKTKTADTAIGEYSPVFDSNIPDNTSVFDDEEADDYGNCSGGSYWKLGHYPNAGEWGADENVNGGGVVYSDFDVYPDNNIDLIYLHFEQDVSFGSKFWRDFPGGWGRPGAYLHMNLAMDAPLSPYWHECFEIYKASGYENYDFSPKGPNGNTENNTSNSSPAFPFALHQTYPNPAKSGSVNFAFSVPDNCRATLSVFDITGRKVAVPFDEKIVPGEYSTGLSTTSLPAGVYIYKLEAGDDIAVKKMIITR